MGLPSGTKEKLKPFHSGPRTLTPTWEHFIASALKEQLERGGHIRRGLAKLRGGEVELT